MDPPTLTPVSSSLAANTFIEVTFQSPSTFLFTIDGSHPSATVGNHLAEYALTDRL